MDPSHFAINKPQKDQESLIQKEPIWLKHICLQNQFIEIKNQLIIDL